MKSVKTQLSHNGMILNMTDSITDLSEQVVNFENQIINK